MRSDADDAEWAAREAYAKEYVARDVMEWEAEARELLPAITAGTANEEEKRRFRTVVEILKLREDCLKFAQWREQQGSEESLPRALMN
jgi:hypothetical protein